MSVKPLPLSAGALLIACLAAQAFVPYRTPTGAPQRWNFTAPFDPAIPTSSFNPASRAIRFYLGSNGWSSTNTAAELNATRAAFAQWQAVSGSVLRFEEGGAVPPGTDANTTDGTNVVFWAKDSLFVNGGRDYIGGTMGVTYTRLQGEFLAEADIVLNGIQYRWFTDPTKPDNNAQFAEGIILHEIGHLLGLAHSPIGAATLFARGDSGVNLQAGLSPDEFAAVHALYSDPLETSNLGAIRGRVLSGGAPVFGAVVVVENSAAGVLQGTVTWTDGRFELPALLPGTVSLRVIPLDLTGADYLVRGEDIGRDWLGADTAFAPASPVSVVVTAGAEAQQDLNVTRPKPDFWIGYMRVPAGLASSFAGVDAGVSLKQGQSAQYIGVYSQNLPLQDVELGVTGDGLMVGATLVNPDPRPGSGLRALSAFVDVATNATPGLRSVVVRRTTDGATAVAAGFLAIEPLAMDWNFDGLDDVFQRRWFPLFTAPEAAPNRDPDGDGMLNFQEAVAGTNPTNALSLLRIRSLATDEFGTTLTWESVRFKRYQIWRRAEAAQGNWRVVGSPIRATNVTCSALDSVIGTAGFYRVEALP